MSSTATLSNASLTDEQVRHIATQKIFFGHQSVGDNLLQGIRDLIAADPRLRLKIVSSADPAGVPGPAFVETHVGQNTNPASKNEAFRAVVEKGLGSPNAIAMLKYCYVDITSTTDVPAMFSAYSDLISKLNKKDPTLKIVHVTAPLTTVEQSGKAWLKSFLGRSTARGDNIRRNQFNQLLRRAYPHKAIFDLAEIESTHPDGSRSFFVDGDNKIYTLAPEYTDDGGHLNNVGRRVAAQELLITLANL